MKNKLVVVPTIKQPIQPSPGFAKKALSTFHVDLAALCGFGCAYCSTNSGYTLRIHREEYANLTEQQTGERTYPSTDPALMFVWPDVIERLEAQLAHKRAGYGNGQTLVVSMLTDAFSPVLASKGITRKALDLLVQRTAFRIRILTKNSIVGSPEWTSYFAAHKERFVIGLSIGTMDDEWAKRIEIGTSLPSARLRALRALQAAGVPTFGMLCPVFPDVLEGDALERLVTAIQPGVTEHVWAEPYNDRVNWSSVRAGYAPSSRGYEWFTRVFERGESQRWSHYATDLYRRLRDMAKAGEWLAKLRYLLYEDDITAEDAPAFTHLAGVLLQSKPGTDGRSRNPHIANLQPRKERA